MNRTGNALVVGMVALVGACSSAGESSSSTTVPITIASTSTAPTTTAPTPTTEAPLATECVESSTSTPLFEFADEAALDSFGPLGTTPSLQIKLNLDVSSEQIPLDDWIVSTARIPGGLLVSATPMSGGRSLLTALDADGDRRWTRCFDDNFNTFVGEVGAEEPTSALLLFYVPQLDTGEVGPDWRVIDLATGATTGGLTELLVEQGVDMAGVDGWMLSWSGSAVLFGPAQDAPIDVARDHLVHVDLATLSGTPLPFPAEVNGLPLFEVTFGFTTDGNVAVTEYAYGLQTPTMVYTGGEWRQGAAATDALEPIRVGEAFNADGTNWLIGVDPAGTEVWRVNDISLSNDEGFRHAQSGDVTVMSGCTSLIEFVCERTMAGVDTATGEILWTNAAYGGVLAVADGFALITSTAEPDGTNARIMIDTRAGQLVDPSQAWTPNAYYQGCCGDESHWVQRFGGIVVARLDGVIEVWFPAGVALPTRTVSIP